MRCKRIIGGFLCASLLLLCAGAGGSFPSEKRGVVRAAERTQEQGNENASEEISLYATAAVLLDADSGRVLYGKNPDTPMAMASTTKIMTCITVLEYGDPDDILTVSAYASSMPKVKLYLRQGEQYRVRDLLFSLMLESHNDSAVALAEYIGRQYLSAELQDKDISEYTVEESKQAVAAFAALMNQKAAELGCVQTHFITPNGLDATETVTLENGETAMMEHCTTAAELARMMAYCIRRSPQRELFLEITRTPDYQFSANDRSFSCTNHNAFLSMMEGALSGKTGFTNKAGYCYVGSLQRDGRTFVVALLACGWPNNKTYKWSDTRELMQYGIDNYFYQSFLEEGIAFDGSLLQPIPVTDGQTSVLGDTAYTAVEINGRGEGEAGDANSGAGQDADAQEPTGLLLRKDEEVQVIFHVREQLEAPVQAGMVVGDINYLVDDRVYYTEQIVTTDQVERIDLPWCVEQVKKRFCLP
ncbi:MAG: D-alanyl-D-alanine carboxypeptidase [Candidatus Gastranaerophilales bacterium]|nr:D-alanyl-D-alanine carboxypeptidase [Candidatus Gastranaerophilales bacterium]